MYNSVFNVVGDKFKVSQHLCQPKVIYRIRKALTLFAKLERANESIRQQVICPITLRSRFKD